MQRDLCRDTHLSSVIPAHVSPWVSRTDDYMLWGWKRRIWALLRLFNKVWSLLKYRFLGTSQPPGQKSYLHFKINESLKVHFGRQAAKYTNNVNWEEQIGLGRGHTQDGGREGWVKETGMCQSQCCRTVTVHPTPVPAFVIKDSLSEVGRGSSSVNVILR